MSINDGMTTPINLSSQENPRYINSGVPLRSFSLQEIEENNLEILDDEPQLTQTQFKEKFEMITSVDKEYHQDAMDIDDKIQENLDEEQEENANNDADIDLINNKDEVIENSQKKENHKKEKIGFSRFPMSKIKNIMKLDDDIKLCQKNAYFVVGKLTELFLQELAHNAHSVAKIQKRKTMNLEDIACAVKSTEKYGFIDVNTIFTVETIEDLKLKEEKIEKKMKQSESKAEKKDKKDSKIDKINKKNIQQGNNMRIDKMFFTRQERDLQNN